MADDKQEWRDCCWDGKRSVPRCGKAPDGFPVCGCTTPCRQAIETARATQLFRPCGERRGSLFVGSVQVAYLLQPELHAAGVRLIINMCAASYPQSTELFRYLNLPIEDSLEQDLSAAIAQTSKAIDQAILAGDSVYVHCEAGVSRSVSICVAYLLSISDPPQSFEEVLARVQERHPRANPNANFARQLKDVQASRGF